MRTLVILIILSLVGYGTYQWLFTEPLNELPPYEVVRDEGESLAPPTPLEESPPPPPSEEEQLRQQATGRPGPETSAARYRLARLLLEKRTPTAENEALSLLRQVFDGGGDHANAAAGILLQRSEAGSERLAYASHIRDQGPQAPKYALSCWTMGQDLLAKPTESSKVQAWEVLSEAYYAHDDPAWRAPIRAELDKLLHEWLVFSPRINGSSAVYTVQSGDSLWKIAKEQKTTEDSIRWLNRLESDVIHVGKRLKILQGTVTIEIQKSAFWLDARLDGKYLFSAPVGLGKFGKTPVGEFAIKVRQVKPAWQKVGQATIPYGDARNPLGERWLGFKDTELHKGFGIHGTSEPESIGTESSDGCIRLRNEDVVFLYRFVPEGTKVIVRE